MNKEIEYIQNRAQGIARYSDKLREQMEKIDLPFRGAFRNAGIKYLDSQDFYEADVSYEHTKYYRLKITKTDEWKIWVQISNNLVPEEIEFEDFSSIPRDALKAASKRIVPFLESYSKMLAEKLNEYHDLTQKTEKMAQAIL